LAVGEDVVSVSDAGATVPDDRAFERMLAERGVSIRSLRPASDGTLGASARTLLAEEVAPHRPDDVVRAQETLELGEVLGRGGMGEVRVAKQRSLRREVAVKTVLEEYSPTTRNALLKEAWAGGALEHPSVVPIHTLTEIGGAPAVVMKRIAGTSWLTLIEEPRGDARFSGDGALEAHLRVLVQVCHAVAFAHARGILHLDLKPENVMVGELGEVYVLDWGLAARTETGPAWLPLASTLQLPAGTPGYLAPELAGAQPERVGPATDVYLLGAVLHHVVTGEMRHPGSDLLKTLVRAYNDGPPAYDAKVPRGLVPILQRALQREPSDRFPSADAMREAIEGFLRHRPAEHFMERAEDVLGQLADRLEKGRKGDAEIEPLLAECEVALAEVRREWAEHPRLADAEDALVARRARHAIVEQRLEAARALVAELRSPPEELRHALAALEAQLGERTRYERGLEQLAREVDLSLGSSERQRLVRVLGGLWTLCSILMGILNRAGVVEIGYRALLIECGFLIVVLPPFAWLERERYLANRANRRLWGGLAFLAVAVETLFGAMALAGIPAEYAVAMTPVIYAFGFASLGMALDRRIAIGAIPMIAAAVVAGAAPAYSYDIVGLGGGLASFLVVRAWTTTPKTAPTQ
jgi:serine/threonine-protein kinase